MRSESGVSAQIHDMRPQVLPACPDVLSSGILALKRVTDFRSRRGPR